MLTRLLQPKEHAHLVQPSGLRSQTELACGCPHICCSSGFHQANSSLKFSSVTSNHHASATMFLAARAAGAALWPPLLCCPHCCWPLRCRCHRLHQRHHPPLTLLGTTRSSIARARLWQPCGKTGSMGTRSLCDAWKCNAVACTDRPSGKQLQHTRMLPRVQAAAYIGCWAATSRSHGPAQPNRRSMR